MSQLLVQVKDLKKIYRTQKNVHEALKGVSLDIYKGEVFGLLGANGAGKTTLSSIIASLHPPTSGTVHFEGHSIYENLAAYRSSIGFCPQKPNLNPFLTLEDNIRFAGHYFGMTDNEITLRLKDLSKQFELGKYLKDKAQVLSGGYKQRFMIARSLIHNPRLLILDEPTVGLDPHIRRQLWKTIRDMKEQGLTVLLTTHYLDEAEALSDRVCILDKGVIKLIDTPQNLMKSFQQKNLEDVFIELMKEEN